jgi:hypothetical protein
MGEDEQLVAEQVVAVREQQALTVRISQHSDGDFWRVDVTNPRTVRGHLSTTVAPGDSFMMNLISEAVGGQQLAWNHLAQWGQSRLNRPRSGLV